MARPREHDRNKIRESAVRCFWKRGYSNASMADLQAETGMDKKQLSRDFGNKSGLFVAVLADYWQHLWTGVLAPLESEGAGLSEIKTALRTVAGRVKHNEGRFGCLVANTALDSSAMDNSAVSDAIAKCFERLEYSYASALKSAVRNGELEMSSRDVRRTARGLMAAHISMAVLLRAGATKQVITDIAEQALFNLEK